MPGSRPIRSSFPRLGRNVVSGRRNTFTGYVPSSKEGNDYRLIAYESILERDFIQLMEDDDDVISYRDRSEAVVWFDTDGVERRYLPDFDVVKRAGIRVCVEVKPFARIERKNLLPLYEQVERYALESSRFDRFEIWTDREIRRPIDLYNAELRNVGRLNRSGLVSAISIMGALRSVGGRCTVGDLRHLSNLEDKAFWAVIGSLVTHRITLENPRRPIDDDSVVLSEARR